MKKQVKLYNMIFPVWSLVLVPFTWILILPANFIIDSLVIVLSLKIMKIKSIRSIYKKAILKVWGLGFAADILGALLLMLLFGFAGDFAPDISRGLVYNPYDHPLGVILILIAILFSGICIFAFNYFGHFKNLDLTRKERRALAVSLAVTTAPYLMLLPPEIIY